jgi:hypothetical protein
MLGNLQNSVPLLLPCEPIRQSLLAQCAIYTVQYFVLPCLTLLGADPRDGGAGEGLHGEGHVWALPLGAHPPQVPGSEEDGEGLPSL